MNFTHDELRLLMQMGYDRELLRQEKIPLSALPPEVRDRINGIVVPNNDAPWSSLSPFATMSLSIWALLGAIIFLGIISGQFLLSLAASPPIFATLLSPRLRYRIQDGNLQLHLKDWILPLTIRPEDVVRVQINRTLHHRLTGTAQVIIFANGRREERLSVIRRSDALQIQALLEGDTATTATA